MKTTINIDEKLINEAMKAYGVNKKTRIIEMGLQELIDADKRKRLAALYGLDKNIMLPTRRRPE